MPEAWHGKRLCAMAVCYSGALDRAERALAPIRALANPVVDLLQPQPYTQLQSYLDGTEPKGQHYYWKTDYLTDLSEELLSVLSTAFAACPNPDADIGILQLGGAVNRLATDDGAIGNRDVRFVVGLKGMWSPGERAADAYRQWVREVWQRLRPFATGGTYINFQMGDEDYARIRATYGANLRRLEELKRKYDPDNLFRVNRNIAPAAAPSARSSA